mgnify:CR=1 FL=1
MKRDFVDVEREYDLLAWIWLEALKNTKEDFVLYLEKQMRELDEKLKEAES